MIAGSHYILIRIDKAAQAVKREKTASGIYLHPSYIYMLYNLQNGVVQSVGSCVKKEFPEIEPGDIAIFHHMVEENEGNFISYLDNKDELRVACGYNKGDFGLSNQIFGILRNNIILPYPGFVFVQEEVVRIKKPRPKSALLEAVDADFFEQEAQMLERIDKLKVRSDSLNKSYQRMPPGNIKDQTYKEMSENYAEREVLSKFMQSNKYAFANVAYINPADTKRLDGIQPGNKIIVREDLLYNIDFFGFRFKIIRGEFIEGIVK